MKTPRIYPVRVIFAILTLACMAAIFMFSMDNSDASSDKSSGITETAVEMFVKDYDDLSPAKQHDIFSEAEHIIRKLAHYSIYAALGFFASMTVGRRRLFSRKTLGVLVFCMIYAFSDELHQRFVSGRSCQFTDVLIDSGGALTGILVSMVLMMVIHRIKNRKKPETAQLPEQ